MSINAYSPKPVKLNWPTLGPAIVRPLGPADFELEKRFVYALSKQAIHQRTLGAIANPSDDQIRQLVQVPAGSHLALALIVASAEGPQIVAVARYGPAQPSATEPSLGAVNRLSAAANAMSPALDDAEVVVASVPLPEQTSEQNRAFFSEPTPVAEFAIIVADGWHGKGIARGLMRLLERAAYRSGYRSLMGQTFFGNESMLALAKALGYHTRPDPEEPGVKRMVKKLAAR
jgi:GNAT superfamily N-acetyltransferase